MRRTNTLFAAVVSLNMFAGTLAAQDACERTAIDALGHNNAHVTGLNNWGVVVGELTGALANAPFLWRSGKTQVLELGEGTEGAAFGINDVGRIVGWARIDGRQSPVTWAGGRLKRLQFDGEGDAVAVGVNNLGQIIGHQSRPTSRCLLWASAESAPVEFGGGAEDECSPWAINDLGIVVGYHSELGERGAFVWHRGRFTEVSAPPPPPDEESLLYPILQDVNNYGLALGRVGGASRVYGFTWTRAGGSQLLPHPQFPHAVNDWGVIAITSQGPDDPEAALILADSSGRARSIGGLGGHVERLEMNERFQLAFSVLEIGVGYHAYFCQLR